jgi:hypothetical protein
MDSLSTSAHIVGLQMGLYVYLCMYGTYIVGLRIQRCNANRARLETASSAVLHVHVSSAVLHVHVSSAVLHVHVHVHVHVSLC